jgi:hypothetical protein
MAGSNGQRANRAIFSVTNITSCRPTTIVPNKSLFHLLLLETPLDFAAIIARSVQPYNTRMNGIERYF